MESRELHQVKAATQLQACHTNKALSILFAMGNNRPKTLAKLTSMFKSVRPCIKVTPFINPFDALDIINKLSDNVPPTITIQKAQQHVFVSKSEVDNITLKEAQLSGAISERVPVIATPEMDCFHKIAEQICSWLAQKREADKDTLLDELALQAMFTDDCDPQSVVHRLQNMGCLKMTDDNQQVRYLLPSRHCIKQIKSFLAIHLRYINHESFKTTNSRPAYPYCESYRTPTYDRSGSDEDDELSSELPEGISPIIPDLRVLVMLYDMAPHKRPCQLSDLHKVIAALCKTLYVVPPSQIFVDIACKKYVKRREIKTEGKQNRRKRRQRLSSREEEDAFEFAIGVKAIAVEQMMLTPEGLLGVSPKSLQKDEEEAPTRKKRHGLDVRQGAIARGKSFCQTLAKVVSFTAQKKGTTPVEANKVEKKEMLNHIENWIESFQSGEKMELDALPTRKELCKQLIELCIGETRDVAPSTLIDQLQKMEWVSVDTSHPFRVSYNLPTTNKNALCSTDAKRIERKSRTICISILKRALPAVKEERKGDSCTVKRKRRSRRCRVLKKQKVSENDDTDSDDMQWF